MRNIIAHCDGACSGNPGIGGYAAILTCGKSERIVRGHSVKTVTNNAMELKAVAEIINWLNKNQKEPCNIEIHTDSQYIIDCTCTRLKDGSKKTSAWYKGRPNEVLWFEIIQAGLKGKHKITFVKVKAHNGDPYNERCDKMAKEECAKARHELCKNG